MNSPHVGYLYGFESPRPKYSVTQDDGRGWIEMAHGRTLALNDSPKIEKLEQYVNKYTVTSDRISQRGTELEDFTKKSLDDNQIFYFKDRFLGAPLEERMQFFSKVVTQKASEVFENYNKPPEHLIHTTCTGYLSPSPLQIMCEQKEWYETEITHAYHMGCYAAMPTLRLAAGLSHYKNEIDVFHSELCTLHFTTENFTAEQLVVQSLFADGYSHYKVSQGRPRDSAHFKVLAVAEARVPCSLDDMTWVPSHSQFNMSISKEVPIKLAMEVHEKLFKLFDQAGLSDHEKVLKEAVFAIHPGGPRILSQLQTLLELNDEQVSDAGQILYDRGNMSSATLPNTWDRILSNDLDDGQLIVSLAFGPGLTMFGSVMEYHK